MSRDHKEIALLNDAHRTTFVFGGIYITPGVRALDPESRTRIAAAVKAYDAFTPKTDPHGEHDFGTIDLTGIGRIVWKIEYRDSTRQGRIPDPVDPIMTWRVLVIKLAEEQE